MSRGRHRRPRQPLVSRQVSKVSIALTAGGAAAAAPLITAGTANAAPASVAAPQAVAPQAVSEAKAAAAKAKAAKAAKAAKEKKAAGSYTVASGDTLHGIATTHQVKGGWQSLYRANKKVVGDDPGLIFPGQRLSLSASKAKAAADRGQAKPAVSRSAARTAPATAKSYPNNLDGWIREALDIMKANNIPGTYQGIHRNIMRESSGNPRAINNWDINARNGVPSIGLLQVIKPTFDAYHVAGTKKDQYDPVANIVAACNYAAARYGSIDNVNGPY
ncbi:LysM peptidoglycan-binding domain-containing protein [Streptomyces alkaliterrae]|uniref:LysM peptidoglycan-binding domain-containing protein n=1 Tax=Streptomyces alkaliterrae TaxID=2213162 RepID=A0A5P0YWQ4_9ACTN|nr:LysM peptidoglycan-binding domain-containing protein [Streptomyces alkaliterrae]MBB1262110.1 LysM peptidoglycan-binding domain-containing protein [Streptomyces alkaliterrae]MQS03922.1 transglycosylase SLT domain-containing protein [Streptomyces alkaliterrae]